MSCRGRASIGRADLIARGHVLKAGRRIVGRADVFSVQKGEENLVAVYQATLSAAETRPPV